MKTLKEVIGDRIAARRVEKGFATQADLANALNIDRARVSNWERGKVEPKGKYRKGLLRLLKISEEKLFGLPEPIIVKEPEEMALVPTGREAEILQELDIVLRRYSRSSEERRLLALFLLTDQESYLTRYEALPSGSRKVAAVLRKSL